MCTVCVCMYVHMLGCHCVCCRPVCVCMYVCMSAVAEVGSCSRCVYCVYVCMYVRSVLDAEYVRCDCGGWLL